MKYFIHTFKRKFVPFLNIFLFKPKWHFFASKIHKNAVQHNLYYIFAMFADHPSSKYFKYSEHSNNCMV